MKTNIKPYVLLAPALFVILGILMTGIIVGFAQSLGYFPVIGLKELTLKYYFHVLSDKGFLDSLKYSLYISLTSSLISVILGILLAYFMLQNKNKRIAEVLYKLPIIIPHTVAALLAYNILSQSGILSRILYGLNIISSNEKFPELVFDRRGIGIIAVYIWKEVPYIAMVIYTMLGNINEKLMEVSINLGATKKQTFRYVLLPLAMPSIITSFIIIFAFSFGAFEVPYLLGSTGLKTIAVKAYIEYSKPDLLNRPYTMAINSILTLLSIALIWIYQKTFRLLGRNIEEIGK